MVALRWDYLVRQSSPWNEPVSSMDIASDLGTVSRNAQYLAFYVQTKGPKDRPACQPISVMLAEIVQ